MAETAAPATEDRRSAALAEYRKTLLQHKETDAKVRSSTCTPTKSPPSDSFPA